MALSYRRLAREIRQREGILVVVLTWMCICFFGRLPFYFSPWFPNLTDAFFESVSGFTITGATVLDHVERLSRPIQLWRCFSHYRLWTERQPCSLWRDYELRGYLLLLGATAIIASVLFWKNQMGEEQTFRMALFQGASILTTTGFVTDDYAAWYPLCQLTLFMLMFVGDCPGSTAGGIKVARVLLLSRVVDPELRRMAEPQGVFTSRLGGETTPEPAVHGLLNLVYLSWRVIFFAWLLLTARGVDLLTSLSAVVACVFNVGVDECVNCELDRSSQEQQHRGTELADDRPGQRPVGERGAFLHHSTWSRHHPGVVRKLSRKDHSSLSKRQQLREEALVRGRV